MTTLLLWLAVGIGLWQLYRRTSREREAAVQRERLRIARDMHDSLGRRLGSAAVQAGALEVSSADPGDAAAARRIGDAVRAASDDLHELLGVLRGEADGPVRGLDSLPTLAAEAERAGASVDLSWHGAAPAQVRPECARAAYGVVEEGLANAAKHAPGQPVRVAVIWESDALLVTVANPTASRPASAAGGGFGLAGARERVEAAGGLLDVRDAGGEFALHAMLPLKARRGWAAVAVPVTVAVLLAILILGLAVGVR